MKLWTLSQNVGIGNTPSQIADIQYTKNKPQRARAGQGAWTDVTAYKHSNAGL